MSDGDHRLARDEPGEGHDAARGCTHLLAGPGGEIDTPVPGAPGGRRTLVPPEYLERRHRRPPCRVTVEEAGVCRVPRTRGVRLTRGSQRECEDEPCHEPDETGHLHGRGVRRGRRRDGEHGGRGMAAPSRTVPPLRIP